MWMLGDFGHRLRRDVLDLELRLAGDYVRRDGHDAAADGWYQGSRIDRRRLDARNPSAGRDRETGGEGGLGEWESGRVVQARR
jgi:hypothetical protein